MRADLETLYQDNKGLLWHWANHYTPLCTPAVDVEDLAQAGFLGLVRASETYQEEHAAWSTWASYHIRSTMQEALGGRKQRSTISLDEPAYADEDTPLVETLADENSPDAEGILLDVEERRCVREAVARLKDDDVRRAYEYTYFRGLTRVQTAGAMGVSTNQVTHLIRKGRNQLSRDQRLRAVADLDERTRFHAHKGVAAFNRDWTSTVEAAVIWREEMRERLARIGSAPAP